MRLEEKQAVEMLIDASPIELGRAADFERRQRYDDTVTFIVDRNINYTNVCVNECRFCAFFRRLGHKDAYVLSQEAILEKVRETVEAGGTQVMIQGGCHPELGLDYYENMLRSIKSHYDITIHSFTATEILHFARQAGLTVTETLKRLQAAGLDSLPGGGAEILVDRVRRQVSEKKIMAGRYAFVNGGKAGSVINQGKLIAKNKGLVALLGPEVENSGVIVAKRGTAALAAGDAATLDFNGDGKVTVVPGGDALQAVVNNKGLVEADGGVVFMAIYPSRAVIQHLLR